MACILLTDMDPPTSSPTAHYNGLPSDLDPVTRPDPKQDMEATCLTVRLYYLGKDGGGGGPNCSESVLTFPPGEYIAEDLCISAAKACGKSQEDYSAHVYTLTQNIAQFIHKVYLLTNFQTFV